MTQLSKVTAKTARELSPNLDLTPEALDLLDDVKTPAESYDELVEKGLFPDATRLLARALPKREAVWWGLQCARSVSGELPAPKIRGALDTAEKWVLAPTEANRRPAMDAADLAGLGTPAGCVALGAYFSGGSLAPPGQAVVAPPEHLTATAVAGGVILSAVKEPAKAEERFRGFLAQGVEVANGQNRWKEPPKEAPAKDAPAKDAPAKEPPARGARG